MLSLIFRRVCVSLPVKKQGLGCVIFDRFLGSLLVWNLKDFAWNFYILEGRDSQKVLENGSFRECNLQPVSWASKVVPKWDMVCTQGPGHQTFSLGHFAMYPVIQVISTTIYLYFILYVDGMTRL